MAKRTELMTDEDKLEAAKMSLLGKQLPARRSRVPGQVRTRQPRQEQRPMQQQRDSSRRQRPAPRPTPPGTIRQGRMGPSIVGPSDSRIVGPSDQRGRMSGKQEPGALSARRPGRVPPRANSQPRQERRPMQSQRRSVPRQAPQRTAPGEVIRRSFVDDSGRALKKGLYSFKNRDRDTKLPAKYLFDYLCAFVEEAYEHEKGEPAHRQIEARDLPDYMARAIMGELVQVIPQNANLMRACKKYNCTQDTIAKLLVSKGILKPKSDTMWTDSDGARAMGASLLAEGEVMAYSQPAPWIQSEAAPRVGVSVTRSDVGDVSRQVLDDSVDPALALAMRKSAEMSQLWPDSIVPAGATVGESCPLHGGRDMHKSMNLWNPMQPCTCQGEANAYG